MRRAVYAGEEAEGWALVERAAVMHVATTGRDGRPILRVVHPVVVEREGERVVAFHGAPAGEKMEGLGGRAVVSVHETVAEIPSWFSDPERACPATTFYVSAQVEGVLEAVSDPELKARVLGRLMQKYQPEGGHVPIRTDEPRYRELYAKAVDGLLVAAVRVERLACKAKLGQNRKLDERRHIVAQLWKRGRAEDVAAVDLLTRRWPELAPAAFTAGDVTFRIALSAAEVDDALALLDGVYWLTDVPIGQRRLALARSSATILASRGERAIGFARAVSDGRTAWLYDVVVREDARGAGLGEAIVALLLDHPAVRGAKTVRLRTRDAMDFYRRFGFREPEAGGSVEMMRAG